MSNIDFYWWRKKERILEKPYIVRVLKWILQQFQLNARFIHFSVIYFIYGICDKWMASGVRCEHRKRWNFYFHTRWIYIQSFICSHLSNTLLLYPLGSSISVWCFLPFKYSYRISKIRQKMKAKTREKTVPYLIGACWNDMDQGQSIQANWFIMTQIRLSFYIISFSFRYFLWPMAISPSYRSKLYFIWWNHVIKLQSVRPLCWFIANIYVYMFIRI